MRKNVIVVILTFVFLSSCNKTNEKSMEQIRAQLESGQLIERDNSKADRVFDPFMEEKWIGQAVSYGCYREGQAPGKKGPSKTEILEDLNLIKKHWNLIRVYNADDDTQRILEVIKEHNLPIKMMLGVWLENETNQPEKKKSNITNVLRGIELARQYSDIIIAINVGNETQVFWSWHKMASENLINYIRVIRNNTTLPVTTADDYNFWNKQESKIIAAEIDFIVTHIYPLWNGKTLDNAIEWLDTTFQEVRDFHPNKQLVLGEIGWATQYNPSKKGDGEQGSLIKGEVGIEAQYRFLIELDKWIKDKKITTFLFEAFDELWKGGEESELIEIEKNWGVFYTNRQEKESFRDYLSHKEQTQKQEE
jgi:exo-beta-1,3-glucanase (GH17 family)